MNEVEFGRRLYEIRRQTGLSQLKFASLCGMQPGHIAQLELGKSNPSLATIVKICGGVGISLAEFFSNSAPAIRDYDEFTYQLLAHLRNMHPETKKVAAEIIRLLVTIQ